MPIPATYAPEMTTRLALAIATLAAVGVSAAAAAAGWPGPPHQPAPRLTQQGPPPAWVETRTKTSWMAFSSYCWSAPAAKAMRKAVCADMIPPQSRTDLPTLTVPRGALVRIHLAYLPRGVHLTLYRAMSFKHYVLPPRRILSWRVAGSGVAALDIRAAPGTASYLVRVSAR